MRSLLTEGVFMRSFSLWPQMSALIWGTVTAVVFAGSCNMSGVHAFDEDSTASETDVNPTSPSVVIDGQFEDWSKLPLYTDPPNDTHDTRPKRAHVRPWRVEHPNVDLLEYRLTHDSEALYFYLKARGRIGHTTKAQGRRDGGRYYVSITIDVDQNDATGYSLNGGGYYPVSRGYDTNAELEFYDGEFNVAKYLNHCVPNKHSMKQAYLDQSQGQFVEGQFGPYPAGFFNLAHNHYRNYTEWVYHDDDTLTFVHDKGPRIGPGIATYALSEDEHEVEMRFPFRGFLKDENGKPTIAIGSVLDVSFSLEASGETSPVRRWASDTGEPVLKYAVTEEQASDSSAAGAGEPPQNDSPETEPAETDSEE